ncbi:hypothetical protein [uncultured Winogradskyella sp.]|uniref:hypothetical protein n=1 Tax=uncultured Winogradskyella sp. TaxID=395353 RepID=UPI003512CF90
MKYLIASLFCAVLIVSCKSETSDSSNSAEDNDLSVAQKIANAHGYNKWKDVSEVRFTFKVDRDSVKGKGRQWIWQPKSDSVTLTMGDQVVTYNRRTMDSTHIAPDRAFINDKFWMFVPFQLVWDEVAQITEPKTSVAPISQKELNMITLSYPDDAGGYTPGDAYDIYYDNDYIIREWTFRKGNSPEPTLSTTFENYKDFNGIKIAIDHKRPNANWNLNFTDVSVSFE